MLGDLKSGLQGIHRNPGKTTLMGLQTSTSPSNAASDGWAGRRGQFQNYLSLHSAYRQKHGKITFLVLEYTMRNTPYHLTEKTDTHTHNHIH